MKKTCSRFALIFSRQCSLSKLAFNPQSGHFATAAKTSKGQKAQKSGEERGDARMAKWLSVLQTSPVQPANFSEDEISQRASQAQEYSRRKMAAHRIHQKDLVDKLALKRAALEALPPELRAEASQDIWVQFPMNRQRPYTSPPTQGEQAFDFQVNERIISCVTSALMPNVQGFLKPDRHVCPSSPTDTPAQLHNVHMHLVQKATAGGEPSLSSDDLIIAQSYIQHLGGVVAAAHLSIPDCIIYMLIHLSGPWP